MINDRHIRVLHDYPDARDCFSVVQIKGGVCYFLRDRDYEGDCEIINHTGQNTSSMIRPLVDTGAHMFIRYNEAISILQKVQAFNEESFAGLVSTRKPFGLDTLAHGDKELQLYGDLRLYAKKLLAMSGATAYITAQT